MKKTTDSSTLHNPLVKGSQENLQENVTGANSLPTQAPTEFDKSVIVQSSPDEFDAVAKANPNIVQCSANNICNTITSFFWIRKYINTTPVVWFFWIDILRQIDCKNQYSSVY